ncbi:MAG: MJ1477/TM1410 family putative glycoside hydrolase [Patescibacteria group bacterium]|jgi:cysteinyl-tRNA synthetase
MKKILFSLLIIFPGFFISTTAQALNDDIWKNVDSWVYQLQDADTEALASTAYDIVVIDYSKDGTDDEAYTYEQIQNLRDSGKIVLAYLSLGEAEEYRFYWQDAWANDPPAWLGPENKNWAGNYKVKYWHDAWWETGILPYLDRIEAAGFDGVYLDIIDGYYYWGNHGFGTKKSANRMVKLIQKIRENLETQNQSIICPQNGESIIDDAGASYRDLYWENTNCIGIEDLFYNTSKSDRIYRKKLLKRYANHNNLILNVEYIKEEKEAEYLYKASNQNFSVIPFRANPDRELNTY